MFSETWTTAASLTHWHGTDVRRSTTDDSRANDSANLATPSPTCQPSEVNVSHHVDIGGCSSVLATGAPPWLLAVGYVTPCMPPTSRCGTYVQTSTCRQSRLSHVTYLSSLKPSCQNGTCEGRLCMIKSILHRNSGILTPRRSQGVFRPCTITRTR
ncbi:hypothetical protein OH77DRAFT_1421810 [Trametes cingulata]|nr:hypothetical protein OH77DRAFT_1421810 [Trametes cingulata]